VVDLWQAYDKLRRNLWKTYEIHKILCKSSPWSTANSVRHTKVCINHTSLMATRLVHGNCIAEAPITIPDQLQNNCDMVIKYTEKHEHKSTISYSYNCDCQNAHQLGKCSVTFSPQPLNMKMYTYCFNLVFFFVDGWDGNRAKLAHVLRVFGHHHLDDVIIQQQTMIMIWTWILQSTTYRLLVH